MRGFCLLNRFEAPDFFCDFFIFSVLVGMVPACGPFIIVIGGIQLIFLIFLLFSEIGHKRRSVSI